MSSLSFVVVKTLDGKSYKIIVCSTWTVAQVKAEITKQAGIPRCSVELIFCGAKLKNDQTLEHLGIHGTSTLHCCSTDLRPSEHNLVSLPSVDLLSLSDNGSQSQAVVADHFYVFCKAPCGKMQPGKLRVRCAECKHTGFILHTEPKGWDDVLTPKKLQGTCIVESCGKTNAEFFFKCAMHETAETDDCVALHMVRANAPGVDCGICLDKQPKLVIKFNKCHHCVCLTCFEQYCRDGINHHRLTLNEQYGYTIKCPAGCDGSDISEIHHFRLMGSHDYERYQRFGTEEALLLSGGVLCPKPQCGMGFIPYDQRRRVKCPESSCGFVFCRSCKEAFHNGACNPGPITTQVGSRGPTIDPAAMLQSQWEFQTQKYFLDNAKKIKMCPNCHVRTEKNDGCMHMTCYQCKFNWCWNCEKEWNQECKRAHWFVEI